MVNAFLYPLLDSSKYVSRFGILISACILLGEKLLIQVIARNFHKKSYEDRIVVQKQQLRFLTVLYVNSRDIGRTDTLDGAGARSGSPNPSKIFKSALKGVRRVAQTGATALGTVASTSLCSLRPCFADS